MGQHKYKVIFDSFTKRHFVKNFEKKYKSQWSKTQDDIIFVCEHIENMLLAKRADLISVSDNCRLVKLDFAIFGLKISPKSSGNRCILFLDDDMRIVKVLLVYSKNDISAHNETANEIRKYHRVPMLELENLRERNVGIAVGDYFHELFDFNKDIRAENIESVRDFFQRVYDAIGEIKNPAMKI